MATKYFEWARILCCAIGIFLAYHGSGDQGLFWIVALVVIPLTGLTALESLLFSKPAAIAKAREVGSAYQIQSAFNNLATAVAAAVVLVLHWGVQAEATITLVALLFFGFSSLKHLWEYLFEKKPVIHVQRFILTLLLWAACLPMLLQAL